MTSNPYDPPTATLVNNRSQTEDRFHDVGKTVVAWERLRLIYNIVMGVFVAAVVGFSQALIARDYRQVLAEIAAGGVAANLCFCAGPIVDGYLTWFGIRNRWVTIILFIAGTILTMLLALVVIVFPMIF